MKKCSLCHEIKELQKSHYISSSFYKALAQGFAPYDAAPVVNDFDQGKVFRSNKQPQKELLCSECEQLFSQKGENNVAKLCHRKNGKFLLRQILENVSESGVTPQGTVYYLGDGEIKNKIDIDSFIYFALSVLWRGSITKWPKPYDGNYGSLGSKYEEEFRKFLLGKAHLTPHVSVDVQVDFDDPIYPSIICPMFNREKIQNLRFHLHQIFIPGIRIKVMLGKDIKKLNQISMKNSSIITFFKWSFTNSELFKDAQSKAARNKPVGRLASEVIDLRNK